MQDLKNKFTSDRYALMRHAAYEVTRMILEKLTSAGIPHCRENVVELAKKLKGKRIRILHASSPRAMKTALLAQVDLEIHGLKVESVHEAPWLNLYSPDLSEANIHEAVGNDEEVFLLMITHYQVMRDHVGFDDSNDRPMENASIYTRDFFIGTPPTI